MNFLRRHPSILRCLAFSCVGLSVVAGTARGATSADFTFEASPFFENGTMPYRLYRAQGFSLPANASKKYPLIIWLHGLGERGTNNTSQVSNGVVNLANNANQAYDPAFVMVPQNPTDTGGWTSSYNTSIFISESRLFLAIEDLVSRFRIDRDRIYLMGLSYGGGGTWNYATRFPGYFAAIAPMSMSGNGSRESVALLGDMPIWAFAAQDDSYHGATAGTVTAVRETGGRAIFNSYVSGGHSIATWGAAANDPDFYKWLMAQRRLAPADYGPYLRVTSPSASQGFATAASSVAFSGTAVRAATTTTAFTGLTWTRASLTGTSSPAALTPGASWSSSPLLIDSGVNLFTFLTTASLNTAVTSAGVSTFNDAILVNDLTAPTLSVINPTAAQTYQSPTDFLTIKGSASDNHLVSRIAWANDRGGNGVAGADFENEQPGQVNWMITKLPLQPGLNKITLSASDLAGNTTTRTLDVIRAPERGGDFFRQDFNSSTSVSSYSSASKNLGTGIFNDLGAEANGGTWSVNNGMLQIVRPGGTSSLLASFLRSYTLDGPPSGVAVIGFDIALPSSPNTFSTFGAFSLGLFLNSTNTLTFGVGYVNRNTDLEIRGAGTNKFTFRVNATTSTTSFLSNGTVYSAKWFVNSSAVAQSYLAPDGSSQTVNSDCSDLWVGTLKVIANAAKNSGYKSRHLGSFHFYLNSADPLTVRLDNLAVSDFPIATLLQSWRVLHFGGNASNPGVSGDTIDGDGDGLTNLMEYALSGNPNDAASAPLPVVSIQADRLQVALTRLAPTDVTYIVEAGSDFETWTPIATFAANASAWSGPGGVTETGSGATRNVVVQDTEVLGGDTRRFLRLRVTNP